jgi:hypothetical protein
MIYNKNFTNSSMSSDIIFNNHLYNNKQNNNINNLIIKFIKKNKI